MRDQSSAAGDVVGYWAVHCPLTCSSTRPDTAPAVEWARVRGQSFEIVGRDLDVVVAQKNPGGLRLANAAVSLRAHGRCRAQDPDARVEVVVGQRVVAGVDDQDFARLQGRLAQISQQRQQPRAPVERGDDDANVDHAAAAVYSTALTGTLA